MEPLLLLVQCSVGGLRMLRMVGICLYSRLLSIVNYSNITDKSGERSELEDCHGIIPFGIPAESSIAFTQLASNSGHWIRRVHWQQCDSCRRWNISTQTTHVVWPYFGLKKKFQSWFQLLDGSFHIPRDSWTIPRLFLCVILYEIFNKHVFYHCVGEVIVAFWWQHSYHRLK